MQGEEGRIVGALHDVVIRMLDSEHTGDEREYESLLARLKVCRRPPPPRSPTTVGVTVEAITTAGPKRKRKGSKVPVEKQRKEKAMKRYKEGETSEGRDDDDASTFPFTTIDECKSSASTRITYMSKEDLVRRIEEHEPSRLLMPANFGRLKKAIICEALMASGRR